MDRYLVNQVSSDLKRKMVFIGGPRSLYKSPSPAFLPELEPKIVTVLILFSMAFFKTMASGF